VRPAPEQITTPEDLLRNATSWAAAALVQDFAGPLVALRASVQAARRLLAQECPHSPSLAANLADVLENADRLDAMAAALREPPATVMPRARLQPEREIAAATALLTGSEAALVLEGDLLAPRVTGRPGLIGTAVLHLLLCRLATGNRVVRAERSQPARLVVQIFGAGAPAPTAPLHAAAAATAVGHLGGTLDLDAADGPRFEIPLEL
jgi:hypothetical protein